MSLNCQAFRGISSLVPLLPDCRSYSLFHSHKIERNPNSVLKMNTFLFKDGCMLYGRTMKYSAIPAVTEFCIQGRRVHAKADSAAMGSGMIEGIFVISIRVIASATSESPFLVLPLVGPSLTKAS